MCDSDIFKVDSDIFKVESDIFKVDGYGGLSGPHTSTGEGSGSGHLQWDTGVEPHWRSLKLPKIAKNCLSSGNFNKSHFLLTINQLFHLFILQKFLK